eukprot:13228409-Heterocapsa_arctica.AAC.1
MPPDGWPTMRVAIVGSGVKLKATAGMTRWGPLGGRLLEGKAPPGRVERTRARRTRGAVRVERPPPWG